MIVEPYESYFTHGVSILLLHFNLRVHSQELILITVLICTSLLLRTFCAHTVQITHNLNGPRMSHASDMKSTCVHHACDTHTADIKTCVAR